MPRDIKTVQDFVRAFDEFLDEEDPATPEEIDAELREAGIDPDEEVAKVQLIVARALAESR